ncbi:class I SAM-dependent methyltransferase [Streptomyces sp. NPDC051322]|uniref:class I SAM-dependent methyltransferase n=1 Tax=Streptomyces sp. NPDC051322 TaxID=3154645 RepID=UPI00344C6D5F
MTELARSSDSAAAQYAATRPGYPPTLFDAVEVMADRAFEGAHVIDVGAGTGFATGLMRDRGADVLAVEPGPAMAAQLRTAHPDIRLVQGDGDALPVASGCADFVTYAQAWHWTEPTRSIPEALRVLKPRGVLALWWNALDPAAAWAAEQETRLRERLPDYYQYDAAPKAPVIIKTLYDGLTPAFRRLQWSREVTIDAHLAHLTTRSQLAVTDREKAAPVLAEERAELLRIFPDGVVREQYVINLTAVRKPAR